MNEEIQSNSRYYEQTDNSLEHQKVFSFSPCQFKHNKLVNKQLPSIEVDVNANTITCKDSQAQISIARATNPLSTTNTISYFQVEVQKSNIQSGLNVGLVGKDISTRTLAGKSLNSIGFITNQIYCNKKKVAVVQSAKQKDRIGCGINCLSMTFFFTKNRKILHDEIPIPQAWTQFYPAVGAQNQNECIKCYFQKHLFTFDIDKYILKTQQQIRESIDQEQASACGMYSLISQYMLFNGHTKTYELMNEMKDQIGFKPVKKLTKNQFTNYMVTVDQPYSIQQLYNEAMMEVDDYQGERTQQQKLMQKSRQRFKSDVHPQMLMQIEQDTNNVSKALIRKRTQNQIQIPQQINFRKQSYVSNISLLEDQQQMQNQLNYLAKGKLKNQQLQKSIMQNQRLTAHQTFLLTERLDIIEFIKQKKIEEAFTLLKNRVSKIFQKEELLQIYLKAHIFLRKINQEGPIFALNYAKQEVQFKKYQDRLFPTYNYRQKKIQEVPLKKIFGAIAHKSGEVNDLLRPQQFQAFSRYVNSIIMKHMGIMQDCRLGLWIQHLAILQRKTKDFKGMACGIQLNF